MEYLRHFNCFCVHFNFLDTVGLVTGGTSSLINLCHLSPNYLFWNRKSRVDPLFRITWKTAGKPVMVMIEHFSQKVGRLVFVKFWGGVCALSKATIVWILSVI